MHRVNREKKKRQIALDYYLLLAVTVESNTLHTRMQTNYSQWQSGKKNHQREAYFFNQISEYKPVGKKRFLNHAFSDIEISEQKIF